MQENHENHEKHEDNLSRRAFLTAAATALAAAGLAGCGAVTEDKIEDKSIASSNPVTANVQRITDKLFSVEGGAKLKADEALPFVLPTTNEPGVLLRDKAGKWHAMSAKCTHVGCVVVWQSDVQKLQCPCHASQFDTRGKVLGGPAKKPLPQWKAETKGDDVLVSI